MDFRTMFLGDAEKMDGVKKKGKVGAIALLIAVVVSVLSPILAGIFNVVYEIFARTMENGVAVQIGVAAVAVPVAVLYGIPYILRAVGVFTKKKIIAVIGSIFVLISAVISAIASIVGLVSAITLVFTVEMTGLGLITTILSAIVNLGIGAVGLLGAVALLLLFLFAEKDEKLSTLATIGTQVVLAVLYVVSGLISLIRWLVSFLTILFDAGLTSSLYTLKGILNVTDVIPSIVLCVAVALLAVGVMRAKRERAASDDGMIEGEAVDITEIPEDAEEKADAEAADDGEVVVAEE